jgi:hypothetical protein
MSVYLIVVAALILAPWVLALAYLWLLLPLKLRKRQPLRAEPNFEVTQLEHLSAEMRDFLGSAIRQFIAEGFKVVANVREHDSIPGGDSVKVLLVNTAGDIASIIAVVFGLRRNLTFFVGSRFADGRRIVTGCNRDITVTPRDPSVDGMVFSWVRDARTLCEIHHRRLRSLGRDAQRRIGGPTPGQEMEYLREQRQKEVQRWVDIGHRFLDEKEGVYRYTIRGVYLSAWRMLPPIKGWRIRGRDRRARRMWKKLSMDTWAPPQPPAPVTPTATVMPDALAVLDHPSIQYEARLRVGEIHQAWQGDTLLVQGGAPSVAATLAARWANVAGIIFLPLVISLMLFSIWSRYRLRRMVPGMGLALTSSYEIALLVLLGLFLTMDLWRVIKALRRAGSVTSIYANHSGLHFTNAPGHRRHGQLARDDIAGFAIVLASAKLTGKTYRLVASFHDARKRQPLLLTHEKAALVNAQAAIAQALGIVIDVTEAGERALASSPSLGTADRRSSGEGRSGSE